MPTKKVIEKQLLIKTTDKKIIYATLGLPAKASKNIVVFVHGLTSTALWPPMLLGSWYFRKQGYAYCRVNLYDWRPEARTLMTSDLLQHSKDVDTVVQFLKRQGYKNIFAVGHSFGGLTLLQAKTAEFKAISLWDISSFITYPPRKWLKKDKLTGAVFMQSSCEFMMSKRYLAGIENFPNELELASKIKVPTQICYAHGPNALLVQSSKRYFDSLDCEKELFAVPNSSHSFTEEGVGEKLFNQSRKFFAKYLD